MADVTKEVVLSWKLGPVLKDEAGQPQTDEHGAVKRGDPIALTTVTIKTLTTREAMDADDFALAASPTGRPSQENKIRAYAICAIRKINGEAVEAPQDFDDYEEIRDRLTVDEVGALGRENLAFAAQLAVVDDPKDLPPPKS
jgi:hypothetical protein